MFDYPLPIPLSTHYTALGLSPESTVEEIREAMEERVIALKRRKEAVDRRMEKVYQAVPELRSAYDKIQILQTGSQESGSTEFLHELRRLGELEQKAERIDPEFKQLRERAAELEGKIHELNRMPLQNPEARTLYDMAHPPLALLKLAACARDEFADTKLTLVLVRRELTCFFVAQGEGVFHPSDLTRDDFLADFSFNPLLDET
jgi:hypothetical protein